MHMCRLLVAFFIFFSAQLAAAQGAPTTSKCSTATFGASVCISETDFADDLCTALEVLSDRYSLNPYFFTRLIWQESKFDPNARSSAKAMGIAQFIASTAEIRGLDEPFNPAEALDVSARYLVELDIKFGNLGLAAAAYNAGETAAKNFKNQSAGLPNETWKYVQIITGLDPRKWRDTPPEIHDFTLTKGQDFQTSCKNLAKSRRLNSDQKFTAQFKKWGVQLASGNTRGAAAVSYKRRIHSCKRFIKNRKPDYVYTSPKIKSRRPSYGARISFESRRKAHGFCVRLQQYKCQCAVYKN